MEKLPRLILLLMLNFTVFQNSNLFAKVEFVPIKSVQHSIHLFFLDGKVVFHSPEYNAEISYEKCSKLAIENFYSDFERIYKQHLQINSKDSFVLEVGMRKVTVTPQSMLGKYVDNLSSSIMTLKKEAIISCKK